MNGQNDIYLPDCAEFVRGYELYNQRERLGPAWFTARSIVQDNWGNPPIMEEGVKYIIRRWNRFYANYDSDTLTATITAQILTLGSLRERDISSYTEADNIVVRELFDAFKESMKRIADNRRSPVSVAKALSLFAPGFLPIWDSNIAFAYHCLYVCDGSMEYISFINHMKRVADHVRQCVPTDDDRPLLKRIDEYNYSKYTMHWI